MFKRQSGVLFCFGLHVTADCPIQGADTVPIMVIGNKSDVTPEQRRIKTEQGQKLSTSLNGGFIETSARNNENVSKAFEMMIGEIEKGQEPDKPAGGGKCSVM